MSNQEIQELNLSIGDFVFKEGAVGYHFYIIKEGAVEIFRDSETGDKLSIDILEKGEAFGEFALLDNAPRSASAQAITDCTIIQVSEKGYQEMLTKLPDWAESMMKSFVARLKRMNNQLLEKDQFIEKKFRDT